jgi:LCP family protein required for cell wall assembly
MNQFYHQRKKYKKPQNLLFWGLLFSFLLTASISAYLAFEIVKNMVVSFGMAPEPPIIQEPTPLPAQSAEQFLDLSNPLQTDNGPANVPWDGKSPVTILLLGVDYRDWEAGNGPPLSDTIILATLDPQAQTAGMLSIPRDLWVEIPGYGYHKINQAFSLGEANQEPGGGAGLVIQTVEGLFDITIPYYALIDFNAFVRLIDEINGVKIDVPEAIKVDPLGDHNTLTLQPGVQTLPGDIALAYVRQRDTIGSDFDRAKRQQQVILGIQKRLVSFEMIPTLIEKAPILYDEIASGIKTNLNLQQAVQLAWLTTKIPAENIRSDFIGPEQVFNAMSYDGMAILQPIPEEILRVRDAFFSTEPPTSSEFVLSMTPYDRMFEENADIAIRNGTMTAGLAAQTIDYLLEKNLNVISGTNADQIYAQTTLIDYTGNPYTIEYLAAILNIPPSKIYQRYEPNSEADIVILLGEDWAADNDMP